jgi:hypothetical protein
MVTTTTLTATERTAKTVETRRARLEATTALVAKRQQLAEDAVRRAEEGLRRAQERLDKAKAKQAKVREDGPALVARQTAELKAAEERHAARVTREQEKAKKAAAKASKPAAGAGSVSNPAGGGWTVAKAAVDAVKKHIGRKKSGILAPLDGEAAQAILSAIDPQGKLGDSFTLAVKGRKSVLRFAVVAEGLRFETVSEPARPLAHPQQQIAPVVRASLATDGAHPGEPGLAGATAL